ncbi:hypothetical protein CYMTET_57069 [Cymbomonas tetramitiformis]|uniref:Uncharacterized protein n=1 Tax=Cymbomonas tetramitiformis TaxID=36881 RepID=A0AAE0BB14_9CHLO|nr:hypothetical protein CYMTET_57069 [Cymbomonas tetramitiformis]
MPPWKECGVASWKNAMQTLRETSTNATRTGSQGVDFDLEQLWRTVELLLPISATGIDPRRAEVAEDLTMLAGVLSAHVATLPQNGRQASRGA